MIVAKGWGSGEKKISLMDIVSVLQDEKSYEDG